ncbi:GTPase ObgE [Candidatus Bipolaricaulota bacterium]|nr:GTPase ObgE [Candidatus Bipolaricaulota bacterium]
MFIDEATIRVVGGRGGNGVIRFISNKHNWKGGPDGGNGGDGGDVLIRSSLSISTLYRFRNRPKFTGEQGGDGGSNNKQGARGKPSVILVPVGTIVRDARTGDVLADLATPDEEVVVARGGEGGRGNNSFVTSSRQAPRICERGLAGEMRTLRMELRLIADVGIIGYPNVGKSSMISRVSGVRAKVADYPFTTITPNLGVVDVDGVHQFVAVDIPGLIEGAHTGKGLGDRFLRHVKRTRVLIHMIDLAKLEGRDPLEDHRRINEELRSSSEELGAKPQIVVGNKIDLLDEDEIEQEKERFAAIGVDIIPISVATGLGLRDVVNLTYNRLQSIGVEVSDRGSTLKRRVYRFHDEEGFRVEQDGEAFIIRGQTVERLVAKLVLDSRDAQEYLSDRLERMGVFQELGRHGFTPGDPLRIGEVELELER